MGGAIGAARPRRARWPTGTAHVGRSPDPAQGGSRGIDAREGENLTLLCRMRTDRRRSGEGRSETSNFPSATPIHEATHYTTPGTEPRTLEERIERTGTHLYARLDPCCSPSPPPPPPSSQSDEPRSLWSLLRPTSSLTRPPSAPPELFPSTPSLLPLLQLSTLALPPSSAVAGNADAGWRHRALWRGVRHVRSARAVTSCDRRTNQVGRRPFACGKPSPAVGPHRPAPLLSLSRRQSWCQPTTTTRRSMPTAPVVLARRDPRELIF